MKKFITAKEAREQSKIKAVLKLAERKKQQLAYIDKLIRRSVEEGETSVTCYEDIFDEVAEMLLNAGYLLTIEPYGNSNSLYRIRISWSYKDCLIGGSNDK